MNGLKHGWKFLFGIEIRGRRDADRSDDSGTQIGENVAEKIGTHDNIKPIRVPHKMCGQDIDVELVRDDLREFSRHRMKALIPKGHGVNDAV
jgi:hypothetical protein